MSALLILSLVLSGCASSLSGGGGPTAIGTASAAPAHPLKTWLRQQSRARRGAVAGAIAGALLGYQRARILGHDPAEGAAAGAVAGALAGYLIGRRQDTLHGSRDDAAARLGYDRSQGYVLAVEEARFEPPRIAPGGTARVYVRYLVVGPSNDEDLTIDAFTGVKYGGNYMNAIGPDTFVVPRGGGIVETRSEITIPAKAPPGTYSIEALFEDRAGRFQSSRESLLYVG
jgi:hypothetical protein